MYIFRNFAKILVKTDKKIVKSQNLWQKESKYAKIIIKRLNEDQKTLCVRFINY